ncbi:hypothetical protein A3B21_03835 [Candidatus Uhrbacteria bacterium RIFCSPLOWO2_01_FULL_47_24]|uniref:Peptidase A2 domain-containing protein n=1 Tax=Candidatus Uhrbacteria bacterium RIFCSPLOWO2_01_FULL_47_24 TaxID=1802401 RepID=A0A1F7URE7_9BACT|nr:MAG: hypothetical protein A2753_01565 [Candidatus Uhrbacteria bacterium RIFCSPHIGHO2_01_FULL_47_11]OGL68562.1 MAG: hypothetical protein A3D58_02435 [Candidatus Uhrbacteria bacterium RIFCSPHIGHO2_02_FULL_46_47]OGL75497.1 MAG: hypothetical protein A3F52_04305 [Candidatus Uhrbacteria bacterium RIFCSPHIGHO2_12_FULL_47_11]OGL80870.1 MAG: hypothetical protein A3B21_03835 [Candidatus Uhrbacteria bacterium RIFCSPLOWO2_01_FULL_47_24]OGL84768.1 MAG: hypothetical protein A3J03_01190 [Candidatus Uhrbact
MIVYRYKRGDDGTLRPVADVILAIGKQQVEVSFYIDSGADITLIPLQFGRALGFKHAQNEIKEIHGVSGAGVPYVERKVKMKFGAQWYLVTIAWALIEEVPPLLGRRDIFPEFRITFDETRRRIEFREAV